MVLLTPRGRRFDQATARRYAGLDRLFLLCGRYEGIDERVPELLGAEELSLGDFVLTGGEVAALAVIEATVRLLPGALGDEGSAAADSFADGLLDWPHYTRPADGARPRGPRGAALGRPREDPALAAPGGARRHPGAAPRPAAGQAPSPRRTSGSCARSSMTTNTRWPGRKPGPGQSSRRITQIGREK